MQHDYEHQLLWHHREEMCRLPLNRRKGRLLLIFLSIWGPKFNVGLRVGNRTSKVVTVLPSPKP